MRQQTGKKRTTNGTVAGVRQSVKKCSAVILDGVPPDYDGEGLDFGRDCLLDGSRSIPSEEKNSVIRLEEGRVHGSLKNRYHE